jgi:hypothetical protein
MKLLPELLLAFVCMSEASVIPINPRSDDNLAPLYKGISNDIRPDSYIVTLFSDTDLHDHFKTIGRDLEADSSTAFKWFEYADSYYATNITSDWVCLSPTTAASVLLRIVRFGKSHANSTFQLALQNPQRPCGRSHR